MAALVDKYSDTLFKIALYRVNDRSDAEDLVQETFIAAHRAAESFQGKSSEKTWLLGILKHKILDHYRSKMNGIQGQTDRFNEDEEEFDKSGHWKKSPRSWHKTPESELDQKEFLLVLRQCLSYLPLHQREAFVLREIDGFESEEICKNNGFSPTNLWVMLHRARLKLRGCLESNWFKRS